ncbi:hypothetical protein ACKWTF_005443 [Chironomus riparius]
MDQIKDLCRLCVSEITENPKSLFDSYIEESPVVDVIRKFCFKITVLKDDKLSKYICENCYNILHNAHDLCERSAQSERELHLMLSDVIIKEEQIDYDDEDYSMKMMVHDVSMIKPDIELIEGKNELDEEDVKEDKKPKRVKRHQCKTCLKMFEKPSKLARHEKTHDVNRRPFACDDCFQRFQTAESLERHKIIHSGMTLKIGPDVKEWPCVMCGKVFDTQTTMASHMRIHKDEMEKIEFPCNLCDRVFQKLNELTRHSRTHAENKNYKCQICSKMFSQGSHLIDHLNRHNNVRPHVCHVCNKAFQQSSTLKDHLRTHSQEKPFLCSTCGKSFNNPSNLRQHVKRHMNLKEFECHLCPGKFSCKASLQSHIRSHEGIKSHTCQICGSSFTKGSSLKKHVRTIHEGKFL